MVIAKKKNDRACSKLVLLVGSIKKKKMVSDIMNNFFTFGKGRVEY